MYITLVINHRLWNLYDYGGLTAFCFIPFLCRDKWYFHPCCQGMYACGRFSVSNILLKIHRRKRRWYYFYLLENNIRTCWEIIHLFIMNDYVTNVPNLNSSYITLKHCLTCFQLGLHDGRKNDNLMCSFPRRNYNEL